MIPSNSPSVTSSETSATIFAPPMSSPRFRVARTGGFTQRLAERFDGRLDVPRSDRLDDLGVVLAVRALRELNDEHRLDQRVVRLADPRDALRPHELQPSRAEIILPTLSPFATCTAWQIISAMLKPSGVKRSGG